MNPAASNPPAELAALTTAELAPILADAPWAAALVPVGSTEPHGPHLPLDTDVIISRAAALAALPELRKHGTAAFVAPPLAYGVTDFGAGFAGAISVPPKLLMLFLRAIIKGYHRAGFHHVCLVNNHLEPAHEAAVRAAVEGFAPSSVSVASPLARRWARTLSDEFKAGACHAGEYETSIVMAAAPDAVRESVRQKLVAVPISLSEGIRAGQRSFAAMGMERAYAGNPASASAAGGERLIGLLGTMVATEILEARGTPPASIP